MGGRISGAAFAGCLVALALLGADEAWAYRVELTWVAVPAAVSYNVYVRYDAEPYGLPVPVSSAPSPSGLVRAVVHNVAMGPTAHFAVSALDASGRESKRSNELSITYAEAARVVDSDGDGLTDAEEDTDLDRVVDPLETDPNSTDTDGDGWNDGDEVSAGTNPLDHHDFPQPVCGNGRVEPGEACDDGNARNDDGCLRTCQPARCGDGYLWRGVEECDEGAGNSNQPGAACRTDCTLPDICGDADRDGRVTTADAARIISAAVGIDGECRFSVCDVNGDGQISVLDAATVLAVLSGSDVAFFDCSLPIRFWIAPSAALDEVAFEVDYGASGSTFVGEGEAAACVATVPVLSAQFENLVNARVLRVRLGFAKALEQPQVVAICGFVNDRTPSTALRPDDFSVRVISSSLGYSRMPSTASSTAAAGPEPEIRVLF